MIYYYEIAPVSKKPIKNPLTYSCSDKLLPGQIVKIPLQSQAIPGIILGQVEKPEFKTINIDSVFDNEPLLASHLLDVMQWLVSFYRTSISYAARSVLPAGLGTNRRNLENNAKSNQLSHLPLTEKQSVALTTIKESTSSIWLHGETGSGKTRVYIELVNHYLKLGKDCIVMTPEISLTPQLIAQFETYSEAANIFVVHSKITDSAKHKIWRQVANSKKPCLIIGTRSAIFMPVKNLGLIVVDEAHDSSYKQDTHPKYQTVRLASFIASRTAAKVVFGTATPPVTEVFYAQESGRSQIVELEDKVYIDKRKIKLINLSDKSNFSRHRWLSNELISDIKRNINENRQSLLLLNRRGTRQNIACNNCGWFSVCDNCATPLHYHHDMHKYLCHICGKTELPITSCPDCRSVDISMHGIGTKQLELDVKKLFPHAKIVRYDQDSLKQHKSHEKIYELISSKKTDIIIGTQLITKGFDLERLTTVAAIQADAGLQLPDFSASESTFQMLYQLAGRAGRRGQESEVYIQTLLPNHYSIETAFNHDYQRFYEKELNQRKLGRLPPFNFLLLLKCSLKTQETTMKKADSLANELRKIDGIAVLGPSPSFYEYSNGKYNWQLVVKSKKRDRLLKIIDGLPSGWEFELDPVNLL